MTDCGPVLLAFLDPTSGGKEARPAPDILTFTVNDVEAIHARAKALGCLDGGEALRPPRSVSLRDIALGEA